MHLRTTCAIWVTGLAFGLAIGCNEGGGDGGGVASAYVQRLQACGLLSDGELPTLDASEVDEETSCYINCLLTAPCEDLEALTCDPFNAMPSPDLVACYQECESPNGDFTCGDGETIPGSWQCDGEDDCADASDEVGCQTFECADGSGSIAQSEVCDQFPDCEDSSDELNCPGYFQCADGNGGVPESWKCDGGPDCEDGSDEVGCPTYACANGEMVINGVRCDLNEDCADGSDELGCAQLVCPDPRAP